jgi:hypothetical protein
MPTGRKRSCPESIPQLLQFPGAGGIAVGLPLVVTVVAKVVVDVLEAINVVSIRVKEAVVTVTVLSVVDVSVEPSSVSVVTSVTTVKNVEIDSSGKVTTVFWVTMVSMVVVGTETVCVVLGSGSSVALVNGANVESGSRVEAVTEGRLVGNGWTVGLPSVSKTLGTLFGYGQNLVTAFVQPRHSLQLYLASFALQK